MCRVSMFTMLCNLQGEKGTTGPPGPDGYKGEKVRNHIIVSAYHAILLTYICSTYNYYSKICIHIHVRM